MKNNTILIIITAFLLVGCTSTQLHKNVSRSEPYAEIKGRAVFLALITGKATHTTIIEVDGLGMPMTWRGHARVTPGIHKIRIAAGIYASWVEDEIELDFKEGKLYQVEANKINSIMHLQVFDVEEKKMVFEKPLEVLSRGGGTILYPVVILRL